jgi:DNA-binding IscR family transcriptional regulator
MDVLTRLHGAALKIYLALATKQVKHRTTAIEIAKAAGVGKRTVRISMGELRKQNLVSFDTIKGVGYDWYLKG